MALVPRLLEARGLDVTPGMIARFRALGDDESVAVLETILDEEVGHVAIGSRWFAWCCAREGLEPAQTFLHLLRTWRRARCAALQPRGAARGRLRRCGDAQLAALAAQR
jgi:uncharacterized ferritin-like protein (DUF455 family)